MPRLKAVKEENVKRVTINADASLADAFYKTCRDHDSTGAQEIRKFMKTYIAKNSQRKLL